MCYAVATNLLEMRITVVYIHKVTRMEGRKSWWWQRKYEMRDGRGEFPAYVRTVRMSHDLFYYVLLAASMPL